jgi:integrase
MLYAAKLRDEIIRKIAIGQYDPCDYFPESDKCRLKEVESTMTVEAMALEWLKLKASTLAVTTLGEYRNALNCYLLAQMGHDKCSSLTYAKMARHVSGLKFVSGKTRNNVFGVISGVLKYGIKAKYIADIEVKDALEQHRVQKPAPDPLTRDEALAIIAHIEKKNPAMARYFTFAFFTGLRPSEMIALQWGDIDFRAGSMRVQRARVRSIDKDTKTHTARDVELSEPAMQALKEQKATSFMAGTHVWLAPSGTVFADTDIPVRVFWRPALRALGIRDRDARQTRHTYATICLMAGMNPAYVSRQMGHSSPKMLFEVYSRWIDGADGGRQKGLLDAFISGQKPHERPTNLEESVSL